MKKIRSIGFFLYCNGFLGVILALAANKLGFRPTLFVDSPELIVSISIIAVLVIIVDYTYYRQWLASRPPKKQVFVRPDEPYNWWNSY